MDGGSRSGSEIGRSFTIRDLNDAYEVTLEVKIYRLGAR